MPTKLESVEAAREGAWHGFKPGHWQSRVNVRDFIQRNYTPYEGDAAFLAKATPRTRALWDKPLPLLAEERSKGVLAVSQEPSSIFAHHPGCIDKNRRFGSGSRDPEIALYACSAAKGLVRQQGLLSLGLSLSCSG
jgi:formate C-acetyltransferase